jgi:hypothetical protein
VCYALFVGYPYSSCTLKNSLPFPGEWHCEHHCRCLECNSFGVVTLKRVFIKNKENTVNRLPYILLAFVVVAITFVWIPYWVAILLTPLHLGNGAADAIMCLTCILSPLSPFILIFLLMMRAEAKKR